MIDEMSKAKYTHELSKTEDDNDQKLLVPWLVDCLDQNRFKDFRWHNQKKKVFQVPWSHKSANHWSPECVAVPTAWAIYKGKYDDRRDDFKRLKSTFRCALNSRKELVLLKKNNRYRFWMILPEKHVAMADKKERARRARTKRSCSLQAKKSAELRTSNTIQSQSTNTSKAIKKDIEKIEKKPRGRPKKIPESSQQTKNAQVTEVIQSTSHMPTASVNTSKISEVPPRMEDPRRLMECDENETLPPFGVWRQYSDVYYPPSPPQDQYSFCQNIPCPIPSFSWPGDICFQNSDIPSNYCPDRTYLPQFDTVRQYTPSLPELVTSRNQTETPPPEQMSSPDKYTGMNSVPEDGFFPDDLLPLSESLLESLSQNFFS